MQVNYITKEDYKPTSFGKFVVFSFSRLFFYSPLPFGGEQGIRRASPFTFTSFTTPIVFAFGEGVRIPFYFFIKKKKQIPTGICILLAESKGFEPSKRFWPFTRFPIVLLRPARTTLHIVKQIKIYRSFQSALLLYIKKTKKSSIK